MVKYKLHNTICIVWCVYMHDPYNNRVAKVSVHITVLLFMQFNVEGEYNCNVWYGRSNVIDNNNKKKNTLETLVFFFIYFFVIHKFEK